MTLKNLKVPDIYPAKFAGIVKKILAAQVPTGKLGQLANFISQHRHIQLANDLARMDAMPGVSLLSRLVFNFARIQLAIRPRIKLVTISTLLLMVALILANRGVEELDAKKPEIKVAGQAVLIAQDIKPSDEETQLDAEIAFKESPFDFKMPVRGYISQGYHGGHRAIDIATGVIGAPITALGEGKVEFAGFLTDGKGNVVIVDHGDGLKSLYAHMGKISVAVGNEVDSGTLLGTVGLTGHTTGAHVHLEIYDDNIAVDPQKVLPDVENPLGLAPKAEAVPHTDSSSEG